MVVDRALLAALRAAKRRALGMIDEDIDLLGLGVEVHIRDKPWG